jgi:lysophospholipase L1-like esterase
VVFLLSVSKEAAMTRPPERPRNERPRKVRSRNERPTNERSQRNPARRNATRRDHPARKRMRRLDILVGSGVIIAALAATWALIQPDIEHTEPSGNTVVTFLGNSFTGGSLMDSGPNSRWPAIVSKKLDLSDVVITADASGYVTRGVGFATYGDLADDVPEDSAAVVILGSDDDANKPYEKIKAAVLATFATIHARAPHARILAIATFWVNKHPPKGIITSRDAVRDAAKQAGVMFADPIAEGWMVDDPSKTIGGDGLHPTDTGQRELAERLEPLLAELLKQPAP